MKSKYGYLTFEWDVMFTNDTENSESLSTFEDIDLSNCLEAHVQIKMKYGYKILKIFMKDTIEFNEFIEECKKRMYGLSIDNSKIKYRNAYRKKLLEFIKVQFEKSPV